MQLQLPQAPSSEGLPRVPDHTQAHVHVHMQVIMGMIAAHHTCLRLMQSIWSAADQGFLCLV